MLVRRMNRYLLLIHSCVYLSIHLISPSRTRGLICNTFHFQVQMVQIVCTLTSEHILTYKIQARHHSLPKKKKQAELTRPR